MNAEQRNKIVIRSELSQPVSVCILLNQGKYVMQLRDEKEGINEPGRWGLFGGYRHQFEMPARAMKRELKEEIGLEVTPKFAFSWQYSNVFHADITDQYDKIILGEGQSFGSYTLDELCEMETSRGAISVLSIYETYEKEDV